MRDPYTMRCVDVCPNNTFWDPNTDQCVQECPTDNSSAIFYGDSSLTEPTCVLADNCSSGYYADGHVGLCV